MVDNSHDDDVHMPQSAEIRVNFDIAAKKNENFIDAKNFTNEVMLVTT
jgi:hypothetical protein